MAEPRQGQCPGCGDPVLAVRVRHRDACAFVLAEPFEWEPRARCYVCAGVESRVNTCPRCRGIGRANGSECSRCEGTGEVANRRANCDRCGGTGYVGEERPREMLLAIDVAWSDDGHVRLIGPETSRKRGEGLFRLHRHDAAVIMRRNPNGRTARHEASGSEGRRRIRRAAQQLRA